MHFFRFYANILTNLNKLIINTLYLASLLLERLGITDKRKFMLDPKKKQQIIKKFKTHEDDTGSPQVQIAILTEEIKELTQHLKTHKKDISSRRGLFRKVNQRRKLLQYLEKTDHQTWEDLIKKLKLKKKITLPGLVENEPTNAKNDNHHEKNSKNN